MKRLLICLLGLILICNTFSSCSKYEEGPGFTMLSKKTRLVNSWRPVKYIGSNGTETVAGANDGHIEFTKDYTFIYTDENNNSYSGTWDWVNDKEAVRIVYSYTFGTTTVSVDEVFTILRLKSKELWIKDEDGDITHYEEF